MANPNLFPNLAGKTTCTVVFWRGNAAGGWATAAGLLIVFLIFALKRFAAFWRRREIGSVNLGSHSDDTTLLNAKPSTGTLEIITDADLRDLIEDLDPQYPRKERWEDVIDKKNTLISYNAKCCRPKDGPMKYLSVTIFEKCSTELLRDFYMDNEYRREWDKTVIEYNQLQVDETSGTEIGCMIKKFPLLTPREYILAWHAWEGKYKTFYCVIKDCEHSLAPRQKKYVRVGVFRSGWRIRKVPGRDACEIAMVHQEDAGLNVEMAKMAFANGIWSYVCKMNNALREYSPARRSRSVSVATMLMLIKKVPPELEIDDGTADQATPDVPTSNTVHDSRTTGSSMSESRPWETMSKNKLIATGLLLVGGIACLSHGRSTMACILKRLRKRRPASDSGDSEPARCVPGHME